MSVDLLNGVHGTQRWARESPFSTHFCIGCYLLQAAINKAFREGHLHAPFSQNFDMDFPIVRYADDTLIIMPPCPQQILSMKGILEKYAHTTRLKINFHI